MVGNLKKKWIVQKDQVKKKKKRKENGLEQKKKKIERKEKKVKVQFEIYYVKLVEWMLFEKKKLCSTSL